MGLFGFLPDSDILVIIIYEYVEKGYGITHITMPVQTLF